MKSTTLAVFLSALAACSGLPPAEESFTMGNGWLDSGHPETAINCYTDALEVNPSMAMAYNNRGLAKAALRDFKGAEEDYGHALEIIGPTSELYYNRGVARFHQGHKGESVGDFTEAIRLDPTYVRAHAARGLALSSSGDRDAARLDLKRALELAPPDWPDRRAVEAELSRIAPPPAK
jgi:tetratricopeptide (TPR) repeat protein